MAFWLSIMSLLFGGGVVWTWWKWHTQQLWKAIERRCSDDYYLHGCFLWVIWHGPVRNYAGHHMHQRWRCNRPLRLAIQGPYGDYPNWRISFMWKEGGTMDYAWEYHPDKPSRPIQSFADVRTILEQEALCLLWLGRGHATLDSFVPRKKLRGIC